MVFEGLGTVQESGQTNMLDHQAVHSIATRMGYPEAALWVGEHRHEYSEGVRAPARILRGFVSRVRGRRVGAGVPGEVIS